MHGLAIADILWLSIMPKKILGAVQDN